MTIAVARRSTISRRIPQKIAESIEAAQDAHLQYTSPDRPGISRHRSGKGFVYRDARQRIIRNAQTLSRIRSLVIPPAWEKVWISPIARGHLQAVGRDARGRKQYRYHPRYRATRDEAKYDRMMAFAKALPAIRRRTAADLRRRGLPREKVLAAVVQVLEKTLIRVGNEEYARQNKSYGLTTIHNEHAKVRGKRVHFEFRGKSGVEHEIDLEDPRLARIVRKCRDLPGEELFAYVDHDGRAMDVRSTDVNDYLRQIAGDHFTAKDFRTWAGTVLAATALQELETIDTKATAKKNVLRAIESVAKRLGNTRAVCRKCYIHPAIIDSYLDGTLAEALSRKAGNELSRSAGRLPAAEAAVLKLLQQKLKHAADRKASVRAAQARSQPGLSGTSPDSRSSQKNHGPPK
jgi:DNA topoisomerase-1